MANREMPPAAPLPGKSKAEMTVNQSQIGEVGMTVNQHVSLTVASLTVQTGRVDLVVDKLEQKVEIGEPQLTLNLSPEIKIEGAQVTLPEMSPQVNLPPMQVKVIVPEAPPPASPQEIFCDPPKKREIVFTRDANGNIVSAKEI